MTTEWQCETHGASASEAIGVHFGASAHAGGVLALCGSLGAGKTTFVRGLARGLESPDRVVSPSFTLQCTYGGRLDLHHFDAYFEERFRNLIDEGVDELFGGDGVCVVEWAEHVSTDLPEDRLEITLEHADQETRALRVRALGPRSAEWLEQAQARITGETGR